MLPDNESNPKEEVVIVTPANEEEDGAIDYEIQHLTRTTNDILESMRQVASPTPRQYYIDKKIGEKSTGFVEQEWDDATIEDDKADETLSEEMRLTMDEELKQVNQTLADKKANRSDSRTDTLTNENTADAFSTVNTKANIFFGNGDASSDLLLFTTVIWTVVIFLLIFAKHSMLDKDGNIIVPFLSGFFSLG